MTRRRGDAPRARSNRFFSGDWNSRGAIRTKIRVLETTAPSGRTALGATHGSRLSLVPAPRRITEDFAGVGLLASGFPADAGFLPATPSHSFREQWLLVAFVPVTVAGAAPVSHRSSRHLQRTGAFDMMPSSLSRLDGQRSSWPCSSFSSSDPATPSAAEVGSRHVSCLHQVGEDHEPSIFSRAHRPLPRALRRP